MDKLKIPTSQSIATADQVLQAGRDTLRGRNERASAQILADAQNILRSIWKPKYAKPPKPDGQA